MDTKNLRQTLFFQGLGDEELDQALRALHAETRHYQREERILSAGEHTRCMGLVLSGSVTIESNDLWGNRTILSNVAAGGFFAETYAFLQDEVLLVDVTANEKSEVLFLFIDGLSALQAGQDAWRNKLMYNLLTISAQKNLTLSRRSFYTAPKTIRGRVMAYLNSFALKAHSNVFAIPFDRQQLADYLNVERTALSKELGRMQQEGLIRFRKNRFRLCDPGRKVN